MTDKDPQSAINSYITDMLALEQHISKALEGQVTDLKQYVELTGELKGMLGTIGGHISTLEMLAKSRGGQGGGGAIKKIGSALLGFGAAAVDMVRNEGMPKNLRDDYTACSLAAIGYTMLHTTALALGDAEVGDISQRHLSDYSKMVMRLNNIVPSATMRFLQEEGLPVQQGTLEEISRNIENVWRESARSTPEASEINVTAKR
jgi:ferritin-like metal-binding protein YciE